MRAVEDDLSPPVVIEESDIIDEEDLEPEPEVPQEEERERAVTLELVALLPPRPPGPRFASGSAAIVPPHLTRRYERTEMSVADILRGVFGKR